MNRAGRSPEESSRSCLGTRVAEEQRQPLAAQGPFRRLPEPALRALQADPRCQEWRRMEDAFGHEVEAFFDARIPRVLLQDHGGKSGGF